MENLDAILSAGESSFMENLRYLDGLGRGVPMIFREMKRLGALTPEIFADESQVRLMIYFAPTH